MSFFSFNKKKSNCLCSSEVVSQTANSEEIIEEGKLNIKVLGSGCAKCNELEKATKEALKELKICGEIEHVSDFSEIASYGVMTTPALIINGKLISSGRVLKRDEIIKIINKMEV